MGVQVRVAGAGVPVVVGRGDEPGGLDMRDRTVGGAESHASGGQFALHEVDDVAYGGVVSVGDDRLGACVGHRPQHTGGLGYRERVVEPGDSLLDLLLRVIRVLLVDRVGTTELVTGDRMPTVPDQQLQLPLRHLRTRFETEVLHA